jgi:hypothetical protein
MTIMASRELPQVASCDRFVHALEGLGAAVLVGVADGVAVGTGVEVGRAVGVGLGAGVSLPDGLVNGAGKAIKVGIGAADAAAAFAADAHPEQVSNTARRIVALPR